MDSISWETIGIIASIIISCGSVAASFFKSGKDEAERLAKIEGMVETLWGLQMHRGSSALVERGEASKDSPLTINQSVLDRFTDVGADLRAWYSGLKMKPNDRDLCVLIQQRFGGRLAEFCQWYGWQDGESLLVATSLAKGGRSVEISGVVATD